MKKGIFYLFLVSSLLFSPVQARPESIFYPFEKSENSGSRIKEVKENYNELERRILGYADVLKNPIGEIKYEKMKDYLMLVSSTEVAGESAIQEKEGTFRVRVIKPGKYSGINVRYHPRNNESAIVVIKLKAKTNQLESATFLRKENGEKKEQRVVTHKGKGIYKIVDSVFENSEEKELLGRMVTKFDFEPDTYVNLCNQYLLNYKNRAVDAGQAGK